MGLPSWFDTKSHFPALLRVYEFPDLPGNSSYDRGRPIPTGRTATLLRPPISQMVVGGVGILTYFPSPTPFGLGLGYRLTLGGLTLPRKP